MATAFRSPLARLLAWLPLAMCLPGCTQPDNPTPEKAPPPPPAKPEELAVPRKGPGGSPYGGGDRYKKAREALNKRG